MNLLAGLVDIINRCPTVKYFCGNFIIEQSFIFMSLLLFVTLAMLLLCLRGSLFSFWRSWQSLPKFARWLLPGTVLVGILLRLLFAPRQPQVFFDEISFTQLAQFMAETTLYYLPLTYEHARALLPIPPAWPFVQAVVFQQCGFAYSTVTIMAFISSALSLFFAALWALKLWKPYANGNQAAAWSVVAFPALLAILPIHLRMSGCAALENGALTWLLLLAALLWDWAERQEAGQPESSAAFFLAAATAAWLVNWRMESPLFLLGLAVALAVTHPQAMLQWCKRPSFYLAIIVGLFFSLPGLIGDFYGLCGNYYIFCAPADVLAQQVAENSCYNWLYWVDNQIHPLFITLLALIGLLSWRDRRQSALWVALTVLLILFYCHVPSADFAMKHSLDSWRTAIVPALGVMILAAAGIGQLLQSFFSRRCWLGLVCLLILLGVIGQSWQNGQAFVGQSSLWTYQFKYMQQLSASPPGRKTFYYFDIDPHSAVNLYGMRDTLQYASGWEWKYVLIPDSHFANPFQGRAPYVLEELFRFRCQEKRRILLWLCSCEDETWRNDRLNWYNQMFDYKLVKRLAPPQSRVVLELFEITEITPAARRWLGEDQ